MENGDSSREENGQKQAEYAMELKLAAVRRVRAGESVSAVAEELGIRRKRLYVWKDRYAELGEAGLRRQRGGRPRKEAPEAGSGSKANAGRGELLAPPFLWATRREQDQDNDCGKLGFMAHSCCMDFHLPEGTLGALQPAER